MNEPTKALVEAIRANPKTAVENFISETMKIVGFIAGGLFAYFLERLRKRGKVELVPVKNDWRFGGSTFKAFETLFSDEKPTNVVFTLVYRISNSDPDPKGMSLKSVDVTVEKPNRKRTETKPMKTHDLKWKVLSEELPNENDIYLLPHSFTQVEISGWADPLSKDAEETSKVVLGMRYFTVSFTVFPNKTVSDVFELKGEMLPNSDLEQFLEYGLREKMSYGGTAPDPGTPAYEKAPPHVQGWGRVAATYAPRLEELRNKKLPPSTTQSSGGSGGLGC